MVENEDSNQVDDKASHRHYQQTFVMDIRCLNKSLERKKP